MNLRSENSKTLVIVGTIGVILAGVLVALLLLDGSSQPTTSSTTLGTTTTLPYNQHENARADVSTDAACMTVDGTWVLHGAIVNSAPVTRKYQIIVDFVTTSGATVQDTAILIVPRVRSHATHRWTITGAHGLTNLSCVITSVLAVTVK